MESTRRNFLKTLPLLGAIPLVDSERLFTNQPLTENTLDEVKPYGNVIDAPDDPRQWPAFREQLHTWRTATKKQLAYDDTAYGAPQFKWTQSNFVCGFVMIYDLDFFDPATGKYTVDKILNRGVTEFGGYDSVVLWHAYPRLGIDERNQFDFYRDMPGGLPGVKEVVRQFHAKNVTVFVNYNPWDVGTKREGKSDIDAIVDIVTAIDADGVFLDTLKEGGADFRAKLDNIRPGIVLEGELAAELDVLPTHHLSWAQGFYDKYVPGVMRDKWYERRHMQHQIVRRSRDHTIEMQQAWMNGSGMMVWENVFGQWIPWHERDKSILRSMTPIQRRYSTLFVGEGWTPLVETKAKGIFASLWEANGIRLWTLVNRHDRTVSGDLLDVPHPNGEVYYDLITGKQAKGSKNGNVMSLQGELAPRSIACFVAAKPGALGTDFNQFLAGMQKIKSRYNGDTSFPPMKPTLKKVKATPAAERLTGTDMVVLPPHTFIQYFEVQNRECGGYSSYSNERPNLMVTFTYERTVHISQLAIDVTPVTNKQYFEFINATGYQPKESYNFLSHWRNGRYPAEKENHPVVYVDLADARAYASWAGKRLPKEEEWQFAAQGYDRLKYPWGNELKADLCNQGNDTTPVDAFPAGKSPFGCLDMCGNTWEMTESEYADTYNRFSMVKGGSFFMAKGSRWYIPGGPLASTVATKFLLLHPGLDRCSTVGFRCVKDMD